MATSGSWDFSLTANQVINAALEDLGVIGAGDTPASAHTTLALNRLNLLVKQFQGRSDGSPSIPVHTRQRITLLLAKGQQQYLIGPASTDARASTAMGRTTVSSAYASGTSLSVTSLTDTTTYPGTTITMTASDIIGVVLNDGTISYTTISSAGSSPITLGGALAGAASAGKYVYWFTSRAQRFPYIESATLRASSYAETPLTIFANSLEYDQGVADKYGDGTPTAILVEPLRIATRVILDSQPTDVTDQIILTVLYPAEDYDATTNDIAYPQEAYRFLVNELAFLLSSHFGRWSQQNEANRQEARALWFGANPDNSVLYFRPGE